MVEPNQVFTPDPSEIERIALEITDDIDAEILNRIEICDIEK